MKLRYLWWLLIEIRWQWFRLTHKWREVDQVDGDWHDH